MFIQVYSYSHSSTQLFQFSMFIKHVLGEDFLSKILWSGPRPAWSHCLSHTVSTRQWQWGMGLSNISDIIRFCFNHKNPIEWSTRCLCSLCWFLLMRQNDGYSKGFVVTFLSGIFPFLAPEYKSVLFARWARSTLLVLLTQKHAALLQSGLCSDALWVSWLVVMVIWQAQRPVCLNCSSH